VPTVVSAEISRERRSFSLLVGAVIFRVICLKFIVSMSLVRLV